MKKTFLYFLFILTISSCGKAKNTDFSHLYVVVDCTGKFNTNPYSSICYSSLQFFQQKNPEFVI